VQDGVAGNSPYTYTEPGSFNSSAGTAHNVPIPTGISAAGVATGTRASGPFAVLDTIYQGIQTILGALPTTSFPALIVDWGSQTDGTFFSGSSSQHIALLAKLGEDTDEFDRHVVAHEFGHFIEHNFSRADNIGGSHGLGDKLDPRVAFGEGFGYAFAAIVLNDRLPATATSTEQTKDRPHSTSKTIRPQILQARKTTTSVAGAASHRFGQFSGTFRTMWLMQTTRWRLASSRSGMC
jgi:hypothetical protein